MIFMMKRLHKGEIKTTQYWENTQIHTILYESELVNSNWSTMSSSRFSSGKERVQYFEVAETDFLLLCMQIVNLREHVIIL